MQDSHKMDTLTECMEHLRQKGYEKEFKVEKGRLRCIDQEDTFAANNVRITQFYRFEGDSDPADMTVLYAIEAEDGTKGTLTDGFGTYSSPEVDEFVKRVEEIHKKDVY